ncbi:hypothetical protein PFY12_03085 [Chryseobacterium camelliae]|uniref:Uncharacterized protein n=1 Tax=Chryseobacterium camelliae TaxID=1265445 RepID=A0ABY7QN51_9FLAO|nr:hypothetical protein [Chryseobacterium camelliae]WBV61112.1 hypothetical protein PFY12_03085 [Chryseobacterium camelliae]
MINLIKYLYNKYYYFQIKVGNRDIAKYTPILMITLFLNLYFVFFLMLLNFLFEISFPEIPKVTYFIGFFSVLFLLYILLIYDAKFKKIIDNDEIKKRSNMFSILFPIIGFILFNLGWIIKMLQNQGRL